MYSTYCNSINYINDINCQHQFLLNFHRTNTIVNCLDVSINKIISQWRSAYLNLRGNNASRTLQTPTFKNIFIQYTHIYLYERSWMVEMNSPLTRTDSGPPSPPTGHPPGSLHRNAPAHSGSWPAKATPPPKLGPRPPPSGADLGGGYLVV